MEPESYYHALIQRVAYLFRPETDLDMLMHQVFETMLAFAAHVMAGDMENNDLTTERTFEQIYSFVAPHFRAELTEGTNAFNVAENEVPKGAGTDYTVKAVGSLAANDGSNELHLLRRFVRSKKILYGLPLFGCFFAPGEHEHGYEHGDEHREHGFEHGGKIAFHFEHRPFGNAECGNRNAE